MVVGEGINRSDYWRSKRLPGSRRTSSSGMTSWAAQSWTDKLWGSPDEWMTGHQII